MFEAFTENILHAPPLYAAGQHTGSSREGRPIHAYRFGHGPLQVSLLAGCHADEPTGPRLLRQLVSFLIRQEEEHPMLQACSWWIVPHANPDGEALNQRWYTGQEADYRLARYIRYARRALPGEDLEFGFPIEGQAPPLGPENAFIYEFWKSAGQAFHLHVSLHSMAIAFGAWFLIDPAWVERAALIRQLSAQRAAELGYPLHDVDRQGEKGFHRIAEGFCTRPNWEAMRAHFRQRGDEKTAALFHPSSMDSIRSLGGDCLTLVTEMPLFLIPRTAPRLDWPHPDFSRWQARLGQWKIELMKGMKSETQVEEEAMKHGLQPMPVTDQMRLQWAFICSGLRQVAAG